MNRDYTMEGVSVFVAIPTHRDIPFQVVNSLLATQRLMDARSIPFRVGIAAGCANVDLARSICADQFLQTDATHIFWIDSDVSWLAGDFLRVVALCTEMPCVAASYTGKAEPVRFLLALEKTSVETNEHGCLPILWTGLGFACVKRFVIEKLTARAEKIISAGLLPRQFKHIFRTEVVNGDWCGEDVCFFRDLRALGVEAFLDPSIDLGHVGAKEYRGNIKAALQLTAAVGS